MMTGREDCGPGLVNERQSKRVRPQAEVRGCVSSDPTWDWMTEPAHVGDGRVGRSCRCASRCGSDGSATYCVASSSARPSTASLCSRADLRAFPAEPRFEPRWLSAAGPASRPRAATKAFSGSHGT